MLHRGGSAGVRYVNAYKYALLPRLYGRVVIVRSGGSHAMPPQKYALVKDTTPITCTSPADSWLKAAPRGTQCICVVDVCLTRRAISRSTGTYVGAYTTARTVNRDAVFELDAHIKRLASSCQQMLENDAKVQFVPAPHCCRNAPCFVLLLLMHACKFNASVLQTFAIPPCVTMHCSIASIC